MPSTATTSPATCMRRYRQVLLVLFVVAGVFLYVLRLPPFSEAIMGNPQPVVVQYAAIASTESLTEKKRTKDLRMRLGVWDITETDINDNMSLDIAEEMLMRYIAETDIVCINKRKVGGRTDLDDGWKMVCLEPPLDFKPNDCLIYSFGINNEWSFEDQIVKDFGCNIYAYDPSISAPAKRGDKIRFRRTGLGGSNATYKGWKMQTLGELMAENQHTNAVIDYLKIDIEGSEWSSLATAMKDGSLARAKQLGIEFHLHSLFHDVDGCKKVYRMLKSYRDYGFRLWTYWMNFYSLTNMKTGFRRSGCHELVYINERFLPK